MYRYIIYLSIRMVQFIFFQNFFMKFCSGFIDKIEIKMGENGEMFAMHP